MIILILLGSQYIQLIFYYKWFNSTFTFFCFVYFWHDVWPSCFIFFLFFMIVFSECMSMFCQSLLLKCQCLWENMVIYSHFGVPIHIIDFFWQPPPGNSWLGSLIATIIGNLKISISNVHIRYEDSVRLVDTFFSECFCLLLKREIFIYLFVYFYYPDLFMHGIKYWLSDCWKTTVCFAVIPDIHFLRVLLWPNLLLLRWMSGEMKPLTLVVLWINCERWGFLFSCEGFLFSCEASFTKIVKWSVSQGIALASCGRVFGVLRPYCRSLFLLGVWHGGRSSCLTIVFFFFFDK